MAEAVDDNEFCKGCKDLYQHFYDKIKDDLQFRNIIVAQLIGILETSRHILESADDDDDYIRGLDEAEEQIKENIPDREGFLTDDDFESLMDWLEISILDPAAPDSDDESDASSDGED